MRKDCTYLVLFILASICWSVTGAKHICTFNDRPEALPTTFNTLSYLALEDEFHIHNEFYVNFTEGDHDLNFTLAQESVFRLYVAPHEDWDIDLYLYNDSASWIEHSSLDFFTEEVLQRTLLPGSYRVRFNFLSASLFRPTSDTAVVPECETLVMEASIVPKARVIARSNLFTCPEGKEELPSLMPINVKEETGYTFEDPYIWNSNTTLPVGSLPKHSYLRMLKGYDFTLPTVKGTSGLWRIEAVLGGDFLVGGSLGMMLDLNGSTPETKLDCASLMDLSGALPSCRLGSRSRMNEVVLRWIVESDVPHTLWLYDIYGESDRTLSRCVPFTFYLRIEPILPPENLLSCNAPFIPATLNTPDLLGERGYLHYKEDVFVDLTNVNHDITFALKEKSILRVFTEEHRVDIDLRLKNGTTNSNVLASSLQFNRRETILIELDPGNYTLNIKYFGTYSVVFCETFFLEIAIAPLRYVPSGLCSGSPDIKEKPDLSGLANGSPSFDVAFSKYRQTVNPGAARTTILNTQFVTTETSQLRVLVGRDFLLGDLELALQKGGASAQTVLAEHRRNVLLLNVELLPGTYNLTLTTSGLQTTPPALPDIPSCVAYTFQLNWKLVDIRDSSCWDEVSFVEAFETAVYLKPTEIHMTGSYLIPPRASGVLVSQSVEFTVAVPSQIRLYSEPHEVDVDFHVMQGAFNLASATAGANEEEELVAVLQVGVTYKLLVQYFNLALDPYRCMAFDLELAISPLPTPIQCAAASIPAVGFIPSPPRPAEGKDMFLSTGQYMFKGENATFSQKWGFTLDESYYVRATVTYDFVWSNINVRILTPAEGDEKEEEFALGELAYNRNELPLTQLPPGRYLLEVYEPLGQASESPVSRCVPFSLTIAFASIRGDVSVAQTNVGYAGCPDYGLPATLNKLNALSVFSNQTVHWQRRVLADIKAKSEYLDFSLAVPSVFRVFVPHHDSLDIDVILYPGTAANHGTAILSRVGFGEESILKQLAPGNYTVKFLYFGLNHMPLPNPLDCVTFPLELGITPLARLESIPALKGTCENKLPPAYIQPALPFKQGFQFKHTNGFNHTMTFNLTQPAPFSLSLRYEFVSSGLSLELHGSIFINEGSTVSKSYYGRIGTNHAFLDEVLRPGNYTLSIHDPTVWDTSDVTTLTCAPFKLKYLLLGSSDVPSDYCDESESMPTDLYSLNGGSVGFGGPQKNDGSVEIYGEKFLLPHQAGSHSYVKFKVPQASFFRIYSLTPKKNDVDFYIYSNVNRTFDSLANYSNSFDEKESSLFRLNAQPSDFLLDISYFSVDSSKPCNYFLFMLTMKPVARVYGELACPMLLPISLANTLTVSTQHELNVHGTYVFTKGQVESNTGSNKKFRYRITLHVEDTTLLYVDIGFDFLANDFHLSLSSSNQEVLHHGEMRAGEPEDQFNLHSVLTAPLSSGVYYLDINEDLMKTDLRLNVSQCHKFSFVVTSFSEATPKVLSVTPDSETAHNKDDDLIISIQFSDPVVYPSSDQLPVLVSNNHWIYLKTEGSTRPPPVVERLPPDSLSYTSGNRVLMLKWLSSGLIRGKTYELQFDLSNFTTNGGLHYGNAVQQSHIYQVLSDSCNGHGYVNSSSAQDVCVCDFPYTGDDCLSCANGYHGVGYNCTKDVSCTLNTCSGHGTCTSFDGYPECQCKTGYASVGDAFCSVCAEGYQGYPSCTAIPDPFDESTRCKADLLPVSLDGMAYLGFDGEMRLQGNFFIDPLKREHVTTFTLKQDSVFRVHLSPHWVDVDIALYKRVNGKDKSLSDGGFRMNTEESMYLKLDKSTGDDLYVLKFRFYVFTNTAPDCETLNLALMISPVDRAAARAAANQDTCQATLKAPNGHLPLQTAISVKSGEDYTYNPGTLFATDGINIPGGWAIDSFGSAPQGNFFWNITFTLPAPPEDQVMVLNAAVGSSFVEDNVVLLLERGKDGTHCATRTNSTCITGISQYNKNVLDTVVAPGTYTLWLFQPRAPLTNCTLFDFQLSIKFTYSWSDTFYCQGARFPHSLNEPNYLDYNGILHFQDDFLLEESFQPVNFTLTTESFFKIAVTAELVLSFDLFLFNLSGSTPVLMTHSAEGLITARLPAGKYMFEILVFDQLVGDDCPEVNLELAIMPTDPIDNNPSSCSGNTEVLPPLPATLGSEPYEFTMADADGFKRFVTFKTGEIASYPIEVTEAMWLVVEISSDFLTADIRPEMHIDDPTPATNGRRAITKGRANQEANHRYGTHQYNLNRLDWFLTPGTYALKITRPGKIENNSPLATCGVFNFGLKLMRMSTDFCEGEELPTTLSSLRFLFSSNNINYQQSSFLVPQGRFPTHKILLSVQDSSLLRVYIEPHLVDIDLKLWRKNTTTDKYDIEEATAKNGFYEEEVLASVMLRDEAYALELLFYKWNVNSIPSCPVFSMGFAITQTANLPLPAPCPNNGSEHWPPGFPSNMPTKPYYYDSTDPTGTGTTPGESLYFQQSASAARSKTYTFSLDDVTDLYLEASYDFALGDLMLKLVNTISNEVYYGTNEYNRNYLSLMNLIPSKYTLTIYEPPWEDDTGFRKCAFFTFRAMIVRGGLDNLVDITKPLMPISLDGLSYLGYSKGVLHLQGKYSMFIPFSHETHTVAFSLEQPSAFRLSVTSEDKTSAISATLKRKGDAASLATGRNLYKSLAADSYELTFRFTSLTESEYSGDLYAVPLELAIKPARMLGDALSQFTSNKACYPLSNNVSVLTIDDQIPFFTLRGEYTIDSKAVNQAKYVMGSVALRLLKDTLIYAKLGFNFLFDDMYVQLLSNGVPASVFPYDGVVGSHSRNLNVMNQLVPAGNYTLNVALQTPPSSLWSDKDFCMPYSFGLFLQEAKNDHEHQDCIEYDLLPWNLDTTNGGSVPFGGPVTAGNVRIYGTKFLLLKQTTNTMVFTINQKSALSLLYDQPTAVKPYVSFKVTMKGAGSSPSVLVQPVHTNSTYGQRFETFVLNPNGASLVQIQLLKDAVLVPSGTCSYFAFDLSLKPVEEIKAELSCSAGHVVELPPTTIAFDQRGVGVQRIQSLLDHKTLDPSKPAFEHKITFQVKDQPMALAASASFSSLSNFLYIKAQKMSRWNSLVGRSSFSTVTGRDSTNIIQRLSGTLQPDNYTITLSHPNVNEEPYKPMIGKCYPYIWELQLVPTNIPFVSFVFPEGGEGFNPFFDLVIRITLSEASFVNNGTVLVTDSNSDIMLSAFKLVVNDATSIAPTSVALKTSDNTIWALTFSKASLKEGTTYTLQMIFDVLTNAKRQPFIYTSIRKFTMVANGCSGHGVFVNQCECQNGYSGTKCEKCAPGYTMTADGKCVFDENDVCKNTSICGCSNPGADVCDPLGTCRPVQGQAACSCKSIYAGDHCEKCASGLVHYPLCKVPDECTPHCMHGECDATSKTCKCDPNWQGSPDCSKCTSGYSGADCKTHDKDTGSTSGFVKFLTIVGILLVVFACFGGMTWIAWAQYKKYNWKKKVNYFPLGLEELEDGLELQSSASFRDHEMSDDEEEKEPKQKNPAKSSSIFDDEEEEENTKTTTTVDNDFNPRARDAKKDSLLNL